MNLYLDEIHSRECRKILKHWIDQFLYKNNNQDSLHIPYK